MIQIPYRFQTSLIGLTGLHRKNGGNISWEEVLPFALLPSEVAYCPSSAFLAFIQPTLMKYC